MRKANIQLRDGEDITDYLSRGGKINDEIVFEEKTLSHSSVKRGSDIFNHNPKPIEWVIKDLIPKHKKTISVGDYEAGKSFINMGDLQFA